MTRRSCPAVISNKQLVTDRDSDVYLCKDYAGHPGVHTITIAKSAPVLPDDVREFLTWRSSTSAPDCIEAKRLLDKYPAPKPSIRPQVKVIADSMRGLRFDPAEADLLHYAVDRADPDTNVYENKIRTFQPGDRVLSPTYGEGEVMYPAAASGLAMRVNFDDGGGRVVDTQTLRLLSPVPPKPQPQWKPGDVIFYSKIVWSRNEVGRWVRLTERGGYDATFSDAIVQTWDNAIILIMQGRVPMRSPRGTSLLMSDVMGVVDA